MPTRAVELKKWRCKGRKKTKKRTIAATTRRVVGPFFLKNRKDTVPRLVKRWRVVKEIKTPQTPPHPGFGLAPAGRQSFSHYSSDSRFCRIANYLQLSSASFFVKPLSTNIGYLSVMGAACLAAAHLMNRHLCNGCVRRTAQGEAT